MIFGGILGLRSSRSQTGSNDGSFAPLAISSMAFMNCNKANASHIVWFKRNARMNPPHAKRVTYILRSGKQIQNSKVK